MVKKYTNKIGITKTAFVVTMLFLANGLKAQDNCAIPTALITVNLGIAHIKLSWGATTPPTNGYEWQIKLAGSNEIVQTGTTLNTLQLIKDLQPETEYIVSLHALCSDSNYSDWATRNVTTLPLISNRDGQIGTGADGVPSFGSAYGPIMYIGVATRSGSVSNMLFTANEVAALNIPAGAEITNIAFEKLNAAYGGDEYPDLRLRLFAKNSVNTAPLSMQTTYGNIIESHTEVMDNPAYDLPATVGWIDFPFDTPFEYTGEGLEIATAMYQNGQTAQFSNFVAWQYTAGFSDYMIGAWPINSVPMNENLILSHNSGGQYKVRPNIKIFYNVSNVAQAINVATVNEASTEITENQGSLQLVSAILPAYVSQDVIWEIVSGSEYASVNQDGTVSAFANGTVIVRAISPDDADLYEQITITITNQAPCTVNFPGNTEPISLVQFAGINNASSAVLGNTTPAQENFETITASVIAGREYPITVKGNTNGNFVHHVTAYIDWNRNNSFEDEGEENTVGTLQNSTGLDNISVTETISVPANAPLGSTKMRVIKKFNAQAPSCNVLGYGQAEDYTVNVTENTTGTNDIVKNTVNIYPNPTSGIVNIESQENVEYVEVINTIGQLVLKSRGNEVNLSQLQSGMYLLRAGLSGGKSQTFKVIKK